METRNRVALVTGGTRGIGKAITLRLAQSGYDVIFTYRDSEKAAQELYQEITAQYPEQTPLAVQCDMSEHVAVNALFKQMKSQYGRIDVVVNNAGIRGHVKPFMFTSDEDWWAVLKNNVSGVMNTCRLAIPVMINQKRGTIINITSLVSQSGNPGQSAYAASKAAIVNFSKSLTKEVGRFGININCVSPGLITTDMTRDVNEHYYAQRLEKSPYKRAGTTDEVANLVTYLASDASSYIIGQEITIDGGIG